MEVFILHRDRWQNRFHLGSVYFSTSVSLLVSVLGSVKRPQDNRTTVLWDNWHPRFEFLHFVLNWVPPSCYTYSTTLLKTIWHIFQNVELMRREALERKLQEEEERKAEKQTTKKKKKLKIWIYLHRREPLLYFHFVNYPRDWWIYWPLKRCVWF